LHEAVDVSAEERIEFDCLLAGMSEVQRALLRRMKEAVEKSGEGRRGIGWIRMVSRE